MSSIEEKLRELEPAQIAIYSVVGLLFVFIFYGAFSSDSEEETVREVTELEIPNTRDKVAAYESKLEAYKRSNERSSNDVSLEFGSDAFGAEEELTEEEKRKALGLSDTIELFKNNNMASNDNLLQSILDEQDDQDRIDKIRRMELRTAKEKEAEEYDTYLEELRKERELQKKEAERIRRENNIVEVGAAIYGSKEVVPYDRIELILLKDSKIFGRSYKRGTKILAQIGIKDHRVFLDITNISGDLFDIRAFDSYDYREGLYSKRAAELWDEYLEKSASNTTNEISNTVQRNTNTTAGIAIQGIRDFFRKKRDRKRNKIILINGHEVILKIKEQ